MLKRFRPALGACLLVGAGASLAWFSTACSADDGDKGNATASGATGATDGSGASGGNAGSGATGNATEGSGSGAISGAGAAGSGGERTGGTGGAQSDNVDSVDATTTTGGTVGVSGSCESLRSELPTGTTVIEVQPGTPGRVMVDGSETTLREVVQGASEGSVVELAAGNYELPEAGEGEYTGVYVTTADVILRGATGEASDVVIDSAYHEHGGETAAITIDAPGVVLADLTVRRSIFHLVHLWENGDRAMLFNVRLVDGGQQFLKSSTTADTVDDVEVSCSEFLMTDSGRDNVWGYGALDGSTTCYTGGIDTHNARSWKVRYNSFSGIYCDTEPGRPAHGKRGDLRDDQTYGGGLAEHAIHMWDAEALFGHEILGNTIIDCGRGIGVGLTDPVHDSLVANNSVFSSFPASAEHDVGISIERGVNVDVVHNTVFFSDPEAYENGIEVRFDVTDGVNVENNLTNRQIRDRDGAVSNQVGNVDDATSELFVDPAAGDLHIADCDAAPTGPRRDGVTSDLDGEPRADETTIGADECAP